jgi:hypothetical protein
LFLAHGEQSLWVVVAGLAIFLCHRPRHSAVCYDIESAIGRNRVRWSLTKDGAHRFLQEREPDHFIIARGGKALWTGREFLEEHNGGKHDA